MLELLLKKLEEGGTYSLSTLAREFDVSQSQVEQMIEHLARMGYLKSISGCEQGHCPGCSSASSCNTNAFAHLWSFRDQTDRCSQEWTPSRESKQDPST